MAKIYVGDIKADAIKLVGWAADYQERTGDRVDFGRDEGGDFMQIAGEKDSVFAALRFG